MAFTKPLVAVVDDDEAVREGLADLIRSLGYSATVFADAQSFWESPQRVHTALLISDVQMPGMSGVELYEKVAASQKPIPAILITAYPREDECQRALNAGASCYIKKPFTEQELLDCIRIALGPSTA